MKLSKKCRDKSSLILNKVSSKCLYLDEVIDIKFVKDSQQVLLCTNSEILKLLDLNSGEIELYPGHTDIVLCLDKYPQSDDIFLSGSKDNEIRMWHLDLH